MRTMLDGLVDWAHAGMLRVRVQRLKPTVYTSPFDILNVSTYVYTALLYLDETLSARVLNTVHGY